MTEYHTIDWSIQEVTLKDGRFIEEVEAKVVVECDQADIEYGSGWSFSVVEVEELVSPTDIPESSKEYIKTLFEKEEVEGQDLDDQGIGRNPNECDI